MVYIVIDLEWNGAPLYATGGYFNEIIEIGAVKLNEAFELIDTYQTFIKPTVHKRLTGRVKRLTHISNDEVRAARGFREVRADFARWVGDTNNCLLTWGTGDLLVWLENLKQYRIQANGLEPFGYYCDAQELCQKKLEIDKSKQPGLSLVAEMVGIECGDMEMHRALDDSLVSAECIKRLWDENLYLKIRNNADGEFIRKLTFKTVTICDINNTLIKRTMFRRSCPACGARMRRVTDIASKNRAFVANYHCPKCGKDYAGKHIFRLKYEGLEHRCNMRELTSNAQDGHRQENASPTEQ